MEKVNKYRFNHFQNLNVNIQLFADPCSEVNCGKHASCRIEGTEAFCVCDEGWTYNPKKISAGCLGKFLLYPSNVLTSSFIAKSMC